MAKVNLKRTRQPAHFHLGQAGDGLAPAERFPTSLAFALADGITACRVVRPSMAEHLIFCATCGVTHFCLRSVTKSEVS